MACNYLTLGEPFNENEITTTILMQALAFIPKTKL